MFNALLLHARTIVRKGAVPALMTAIAVLPVFSAPAAAAPKEALFLKYYVRASGFRVATLRFEIDFTKNSYNVTSSMKTKGLLNFIASTQFKASSTGSFKKYRPLPAVFDVVTKHKKRGERSQHVTWNAKRMPKVKRSWEIGDYKTNSLKKTIRPKMADPLSSLLSASFQSRGELCTQKFRVLDGKTVYDLQYRYVKRDDFVGKEDSVYRGEAHKCELTYRPVAGLSVKKWQKLSKKPNKGVSTFTIWMAPVKAQTLNKVVYVPVGATANLDGRQTIAHLVGAALNASPLNKLSSVQQ